jgi:oligopeptide/dipeptide ABC transporter ATP-binding protein
LQTGDVLIVEGLKKYFPVRAGLRLKTKRWVRAVDGVDFEIGRTETFGLVGESGCGKTTVARTILRVIEPTAGRLFFEGVEITHLGREEMRKLRRDIQVVFQDPFWSLNPRMIVKDIVAEPMETHTRLARQEVEHRVIELLETVGLAKEHLRRYPHEFSGGQRQRIAIARALSLNPKFIVLDEPTSALDVSVQAQIINLLEELQEKFQLTYLYISHDLNLIQHISDRIAVMYLGRIVESGPVEEIFTNPLHPYTQALLEAIPVPDPNIKKGKVILEGGVPSPENPPPGCKFHTRCRYATETCREKEPELIDTGGGHTAACHLIEAQHAAA